MCRRTNWANVSQVVCHKKMESNNVQKCDSDLQSVWSKPAFNPKPHLTPNRNRVQPSFLNRVLNFASKIQNLVTFVRKFFTTNIFIRHSSIDSQNCTILNTFIAFTNWSVFLVYRFWLKNWSGWAFIRPSSDFCHFPESYQHGWTVSLFLNRLTPPR